VNLEDVPSLLEVLDASSLSRSLMVYFQLESVWAFRLCSLQNCAWLSRSHSTSPTSAASNAPLPSLFALQIFFRHGFSSEVTQPFNSTLRLNGRTRILGPLQSFQHLSQFGNASTQRSLLTGARSGLLDKYKLSRGKSKITLENDWRNSKPKQLPAKST